MNREDELNDKQKAKIAWFLDYYEKDEDVGINEHTMETLCKDVMELSDLRKENEELKEERNGLLRYSNKLNQRITELVNSLDTQ